MNAADAADLVEQFWPLSRSIARKWAQRAPHLADEFFSAAAYALWRAAVRYTPTEPYGMAGFPGFARVHVSWAMSRVASLERRHHAGRVQHEDEDLDHPLDLATSHEPDPAAAVEALDVDVYLDRLGPADRQAVERCLMAGETHEAAAAGMGVSGTRIGQRIDRAVRKMREAV